MHGAADEIIAGLAQRQHGMVARRQLLDLGRAADRAEFEDAVVAALRRRLVSRESLREMVARHPRHRGAAALAAIIGDAAATASRSEAERRIRALCASGGLPAPEVNAQVHGFEVLFFRLQRVEIEMDGFAFHHSEQDFHRDRRRDSVLAAAGILGTPGAITRPTITRPDDCRGRSATPVPRRRAPLACRLTSG